MKTKVQQKDIKRFLIRIVKFSGRASRTEFWSIIGINFITSIYTFMIAYKNCQSNLISFISLAYFLLSFTVTLFVTIRRLHDINKKGWWLLIFLVPYVGWLPLTIMLCIKGKVDHNQYGPNPFLKQSESQPTSPN